MSRQGVKTRATQVLIESKTRGAALAPTFFAEVQALIETPWAVATFDFVFPETRGQRPADFETTLKFGIALTRLAAEDPAVHKLTAEVQNLLRDDALDEVERRPLSLDSQTIDKIYLSFSVNSHLLPY